ncbi:Nucleolar protein 10 [Strongyloides ratti]|uniref:Nucleolar protein 10 n=1 Tax=Strongyloides ratti TaxID=34506 RepID=A0A090MWN9_STRRB|nr:Nucleolar protein 10 [Strongyloides ratti]CEF64014.1 Nucleolar protein 10 [Strongyloides ratti]
MLKLQSNNVKIYNLSAGKSLPEWVNDRARRKLEQKDIDLRRRIMLVQDFDMPDVSHKLALTRDGRYCFAAGSYKPFLKCFDLNDLSMKWERGLDCDVVSICPISNDYSKVVLLEEERMRIPKFGRDMCFSRETSDLFIVGSGSDVFRLNLEEGKFMEPFNTTSDTLTCCKLNDDHQLFLCGTDDGKIFAFDHRDKSNVGILDCALGQYSDTNNYLKTIYDIPEIKTIKFRDPMTFGVGTTTGHVLIYDIRSSRPLFVKDLQMGLPVKKLDFVKESNAAISMDSQVLKVWDCNSGKPLCAIEPGVVLNDFVRYPNSGLFFFANEGQKMQQYFVPSIGPAPKWCSYLETITEELEETDQPIIFDDYKFVTKEQLEDIGLADLIGTNVVKSYMHGYFIDIKLYNKAQTLTQPFAYEKYKERKLKEKLEEERSALPIVKKEPSVKVNKLLARKLQEEQQLASKKINNKKEAKKVTTRAAAASELLSDERFKGLFVNPDYEVDEESEHYQRMAPVIERLKEKNRNKNMSDDDDDDDNDDDDQLETNNMHIDDDDDKDMSHTSDMDNDIFGDESDNDLSEQSDDSDEPKEKLKRPVKGIQRKGEKPKGFKLISLDKQNDFNIFHQKVDEDENDLLMRDRKKTTEVGEAAVIDDTPFGGKTMVFK